MAKAHKNKKIPSSVLHKKRTGLHQRRTHHFMKTYWPYIPMLSIIVIGLAINSLWTSQSKKAVLGAATQISVQALLEDTNSQRISSGEASLSLNSQLDNAAQAKANDMVTQNYWAHNSPNGTTPWTYITNAGYQYQAAGENLAYGFNSSADTVTAWMNSAGHRANILNQTYQDVGFGFATSPDFQNNGPETIVVAEYAEPLITGASLNNSQPAASTTNNTTSPSKTSPSPNLSLNVAQPTTMNISKPSIISDQTYVPEPPSTKVSRIQLFTGGNAPWSLFAIAVISVVGASFLVLRHVKRWQKVLVKGEEFVFHHPLLDVLLVTLITLSYVLTRAAGSIR